jgi:excisionase family DNA binding protein
MAGWSFPGPTGDVRQTTVWRVAAEDSRLYASVSAVDEVNDVVQDWLTVPDIAKKLGISVVAVRRLIEDRELIAVRRGERNVLSVPADFVDGAGPVPALKGTFSVLADGGFSDEEIIDWLYAADPSWPGGATTAMGSIQAGFKTEVRRRAMEEL